MDTLPRPWRFFAPIACTLLAGVFAGCGGGAGGGTSAEVPGGTSSNVFALRAAYQARAQAAQSEEFVVTGTCNGAAVIAATAPVATTFEGVSGFQSAQTAQVALSDCTPGVSTSTGAVYLDVNYVPMGSGVDGVEYARFAGAPLAMPTTVQAGDAAELVTFNTYTDGTKLVPTGRRSWGFAVEVDSSSATVLVNFTHKTYNTADQLLAIQQTRYRLDKAGTLSLLGMEIQYSGTSQNRLVYTPKRLVSTPLSGTSLSYPLQAAYRARLSTGSSERFVVSGSCNGTATLSESAPVSTNFEGLSVQATSQTALMSLTDCLPGTSAVVGSNYYDANFLLVGSQTQGQEYAKVIGVVAPLPLSVQAGDAATVVPLNLFSDNTKAVSTGRRTVGYVIEPESTSSVVANFITRTFNTSDQLLSTQQVRYRLDGSAVFKLLSIEIQNSTTNSLRFVYTPIPGRFTQVPTWPW